MSAKKRNKFPNKADLSLEAILKFKAVLLGESGVGKSSLALRIVKNEFRQYLESNIGASFLTQSFQLDDGRNVKFEIWDTAGQERFDSLTPLYYRNADVALVVYDITSRKSFTRAQNWVRELGYANDKIVILLIGNKLDMESQRTIENKEAKLFADDYNLLFMEASAKTGAYTDEIFKAVILHLLKNNIPKKHFRVHPDNDEDKNDNVKKNCCQIS